MPRQPRLTVPGLAHHITQRGNRRQRRGFFFARALCARTTTWRTSHRGPVTPAEAGAHKPRETDSGLRRNDGKRAWE